MPVKSVAQKLFIKPGMRVGVFNAPDNLSDLLGELPENADIENDPEKGEFPIVLAFMKNRDILNSSLGKLKEAITDSGALWIAYYKKSSPLHTDLNRDYIYEQFLKHNLKGVGMISINEHWSAFRCRIN